MNEPIPLVITDKDFPPDVIARAQNVKILGEPAQGIRAIYDALPGVIAKRLRAITPLDFEISEIELSVKVEGTILGTGVSSDVIVRLSRHSPGANAAKP